MSLWAPIVCRRIFIYLNMISSEYRKTKRLLQNVMDEDDYNSITNVVWKNLKKLMLQWSRKRTWGIVSPAECVSLS